ncbi:unnamed protein product [Urochloa humidicola]
MEVQMAAQNTKSTGRATPPHHHAAAAAGKPVPGYLRPPAESCHHVCKYGGTHAFEEKEPTPAKKKPGDAKSRKQPVAAAPAPESQSGRVMGKVRSVFRRRVGNSSMVAASGGKAKGTNKGGGGESVEWKDIVAYDTTTTTAKPVAGSGDAEKKDVVVKGNNNKSHDRATKIITGHVDGAQTQDETHQDNKSAKPPKGKKPTSVIVEKMGIDQELLHGYQILSPSIIQSRASLLRDLEEEMVHEAFNTAKEEGKPTPTYSLDDEEEYIAAAAAETNRPIPAHRRAKSMSISSRSVRYPFIRQASKNSSAGTFKLRSRSTKVAMAPSPPEEEVKKPARMRSRRGSEDASSTGRGIQLRIRSLRRRGVGGSGGAGTGFIVPAVALRHQKTLEKKKSQRLYNGVIEETASKLVKTRKSRVKALVGAFESVISKIAK